MAGSSGVASSGEATRSDRVRSLLYHDGQDLRPLSLIDRRLQLTELVARSNVRCLHLVWGFDDGAKLLKVAERRGLEGIVSKRQASAQLSGPSICGWKGTASC